MKFDKKTYTKNMVTWIVGNATIWIYLTYVLAFLGKDDIAETLSEKLVEIVIGVALLYMLKALVENIFKYKPTSNKEEE